ncbi:hypothetical protein H072_8800 [Dactylellina haptotyla CBS 200.50]|uniref:Copper acquisition factor BIM1-like domain-containing protein n=1 Tax=Dactylellina haptotyla (strain CBS 200.50) TaxID=1284197 RepID=S8A3Z1_DACHA|nr:hypothetical protein H072_8800 [Dactylellina haptotyla CBS 200.50]
MAIFKFVGLLGLIAVANAHFFMETPTTIGFDDTKLTIAPCGGFDPSDRSAGVTEWPVLGYPIAVVTTHLNVNWTYKAALLSDLDNWVDIFPRIHQTGIAEFCLPQVPGIPAWIGQDAVVQIIQEAPDGLLHQCAAVVFVAGGPATPDPDTCDNDPAVSYTTYPPSATTTTTTPTSSSVTTTTRSSTTITTTTTTTSSMTTTMASTTTTLSTTTAPASTTTPMATTTTGMTTTPTTLTTTTPTTSSEPSAPVYGTTSSTSVIMTSNMESSTGKGNTTCTTYYEHTQPAPHTEYSTVGLTGYPTAPGIDSSTPISNPLPTTGSPTLNPINTAYPTAPPAYTGAANSDRPAGRVVAIVAAFAWGLLV